MRALVEHVGRDWRRKPSPRELRFLRALRDLGTNVPAERSARLYLMRMARTGWLVEEYEEVDGGDGRAHQRTGFYLSTRGFEVLEREEDAASEEAR